MLSEKHGAVALTTAQKNNQHSEPYQTCAHSSRATLREKLAGELIGILVHLDNPLLGDSERKQFWTLFGSVLRKYIIVEA